MPTSNDPRQRALEAMRRFIERVEPKHIKVRAIVGDGAGNVAVTGWPNYYWVRIVGKTEMPSQAYCDSMIPGNGMHVYVEEERKSGQVRYTILGRPDSQGWFTGDRSATGAGSPAPEHHVVHETGGADMINVGPYMIENLRGGPTSPASMSVRISWAPNVTFGRTSVPFPDATSQYKDSAVLTAPLWGERFDMVSVDSALDINVTQGAIAWTGATKPACPENEIPVCWTLVRAGDTSLDGTRFWPANSLHTTGVLHAADHEVGGDDEIDLAGLAISKVATVAAVDMQTAAKTILYTVPAGKTFYPMFVVVRGASASLAGGTDYDFGTGANADTWRQAVDLSSMTTLGTDYMVIGGVDVTKYTNCAAASEFGIKVITGSTAACTATLDVFGLLI